MLFHDSRILTIQTFQATQAAYPSVETHTTTFNLRTGAPISSSIFLRQKKAELAKLLTKRLAAGWQNRLQWNRQHPTETNCTPDEIGRAPTFNIEDLDNVYVQKTGINFTYDLGFPHVALACAPEVDLLLSWKEVRPFLDPTGPLRE